MDLYYTLDLIYSPLLSIIDRSPKSIKPGRF
jgi:hypothetical protein